MFSILLSVMYCRVLPGDVSTTTGQTARKSTSIPLSQIDMSNEQDLFHNVISNNIQLLVHDLEVVCEPALVAMGKMSWQTVETVGIRVAMSPSSTDI